MRHLEEKPAQSSNEATKTFLKYYCSTGRNFDYAILIDGKWGSGKTHFIKDFMTGYSREYRTSFIYVSFYGLSSSKQIDENIFKYLHPILSSKSVDLAKKVAKGILRTAIKVDLDGDGKDDVTISSQIPDVELLDHLEATTDNIFVFDDIERCSMPFNEVLGYINYFVEHKSIRAILLANEEEIDRNGKEDDSKRYKSVKEKLIGHIFSIKPPAECDLANLAETINNQKARAIFSRIFSEIYKIYVASGTYNIRSLKRSLRIFDNLADALQDAHWNNEEPIEILLKIITALSFETNSGNLSRDEIPKMLIRSIYNLGRSRQSVSSTDTERLSFKYDEIEYKFSMVEFSDDVIKGTTLSSLMFDGWVDAVSLRNDLNESRFYKQEAPLPAWRAAWSFWDVEDDVYEDLYKAVYAQFLENNFTSIGESLQICGLLLLSSEIGISSISKEEITSACMEKFALLFKEGKFSREDVEIYNNGGATFGDFTHGGYQIHNTNSDEFKKIWEHIDRVSKEEYSKMIPIMASELLVEMKEDTDRFFISLCGNVTEQSKYRGIPILSHIPISQFFDALLSLNPKSQRTVFQSLQQRFDYFSPRRATLDEISWGKEISWLSELRDRMTEQTSKMKPLSRYRFEAYMNKSILPYVPQSSTITSPTPA